MARTCSPAGSHNQSTPRETFVGWVDESPGRGTLNLIVTCLFTIFLCTWVVIHPRVCKRPLLRILHKLALFLKTLIAPEFIAVEGLQEWSQARRMVKDCADTTGGGLKLVHAFYIGMLALRYRTLRGDKVIWPNQYSWLLRERLVDWNEHAQWGLSEENIDDKSNADSTAKLIALVQVSWFAAQSIMRRVHGLPLSQLESMTLSYVPLFAITYLFWWVKPKDVLTPSIIDLPDMSAEQQATFESMAVSSVFDAEATEEQKSLWSMWYLTPRVFEKEAQDRALEEAHEKLSRELEKGPVQKIERAGNLNARISSHLAKDVVVAHWDPNIYRSKLLWPMICIFGASFGALHLVSWDTRFPTAAESWLWRAAAIGSIISLLIFMQFEKVVLRWVDPLTIVSLVSPLIYLVSRLVMIGGVVAAFRASDPAIYDTYVVSTYWIHIV
ncbi:MAG: hypothetical protein Q9193_005138 [Seirophora villosa]